MENLPAGKITADDYRRHVERAKSFRGTAAEYCRRNGLDQNIFSHHKMKLKKNNLNFAEVRPIASKSINPAGKFILPDPAWLAALIFELSKRP